jgi:hypothetical protein
VGRRDQRSCFRYAGCSKLGAREFRRGILATNISATAGKLRRISSDARKPCSPEGVAAAYREAEKMLVNNQDSYLVRTLLHINSVYLRKSALDVGALAAFAPKLYRYL